MKKDLESIFRFYTIHIHSSEYTIFVQEVEDNQTEAEQADARGLRGGDGGRGREWGQGGGRRVRRGHQEAEDGAGAEATRSCQQNKWVANHVTIKSEIDTSF